MNTDEFHSYVGRLIKGYLPAGYSRAKAVIKDIDQPGSTPTKALTLMLDGGPVGSTVALEPYASALRRGQPIESIMEEIAEACVPRSKRKRKQRQTRRQPTLHRLNSYNHMRPFLSSRLFDPEKQTEFTKDRPWFQLGDWGLYFTVAVTDTSSQTRVLPVTYDLIQTWAVSPQAIYRDAHAAQIAAHQPWLSVYTGAENSAVGSNLLASSVPWRLTPADLFVLSNQERKNGAAVAGWMDVLDRVGLVIGRDFALLPTSVHELMIVPDLNLYTHWDLENIVREGRAGLTDAQSQDLFSDKVVWYDRAQRALIGKAERRRHEVHRLMDDENTLPTRPPGHSVLPGAPPNR